MKNCGPRLVSRGTKRIGIVEGFKWDFAPADAPWQNGVSEALVKSVKQAITAAISDHVMTFSKLQTVYFQVVILVNERPIGQHPTSPDDGTYLCLNDLLLGRATSKSLPILVSDLNLSTML